MEFGDEVERVAYTDVWFVVGSTDNWDVYLRREKKLFSCLK